MKVLLYDYLQVAGGAERVTLTLARAWPNYRTVVSRVYRESTPLLAQDPPPITQLGNHKTQWMWRIPEAIINFRWRCGFLSDADLVVYSGFYAPLAVHFQRRGQRVYYCHTIPRFAYDFYDNYRMRMPWPARWLFALVMRWFRWQYRKSVLRMDLIVVNSENVRRRLQKYLQLPAKVVYPPVAIQQFIWLSNDGYYLSVARLEPNKRVDVVIKAFLGMPRHQLVVASGGSELGRLKDLAQGAPNIRFVGWQSEEGLVGLIGRARAVIYLPIDEDFGMSPVEAMAAGKPVIGVAEGGLLETIQHGVTGWLMETAPTPEGLRQAVDSLESLDEEKLRVACEKQAERFSEQRFLNALADCLQETASPQYVPRSRGMCPARLPNDNH